MLPVQLQSAKGGEMYTWLVAGEVVGVHIVEALIEDGVHQILNAAHELGLPSRRSYGDVFQSNPAPRRTCPAPLSKILVQCSG